jgi:endo-1,4-beta-xylanase
MQTWEKQMKASILFRGWVFSSVAAVLMSCTAGSNLQQTEATETVTGALTTSLSFNFEDGQVSPWKPFGAPTLTNVTEQANDGTHSLKTTGRTATFNGPSIELSGLIGPGNYKVSTAVRLGPGETPTTVKMTVMRTPTGGSAVFEPVSGASNSNVTADGWVTLTGNYSFTGNVSGLLMYVESNSATASYYIDTFSLVQTAPPPLSFDFEDGQVQPWFTFGSPTLTNVTEAANTGTHSLKVTNRTASFMGPGLNVLSNITKGATYLVTVSARLVTGQPTANVLATFSRTPTGGTGTFDTPLTLSNVTDQAWVTGSALYTSPTDNSSLTFFIQTASGTSSFYVDTISIAQIQGPPGPPGNTTGAAATFESGTTEGWKPRIGPEMLTATTADAHSGSFSLLTTNRGGAFEGPAFDVTNVMFNGSRYVVSVWAKLAPGQTDSSEQLRVSLQRTANSLTTFHTVVGNTTVTSGAWVRLQATYDVALANTSLTLYVESNSGTASFYIDDFSITFVPPAIAQRDIPSVWQSMTKDFPIVGTAVIPADINGSEPAFLLSRHFNSITSGNDMKWDATEASENVFTFGQADAEVAFAKANNMHVRGHTLVWHNQIPAWVFTDPTTGQPMQPSDANRTLLISRMQNHITNVMKHFDGDVPIWDVVNEPFDPSQPDGLRRSTWYNIIGPEYIDIALQAARAAQPNAKLYINDFDSTNPARVVFMVSKLNDLKTRGIPIDGFGHQMHNNIEYPPVQTIVDAINKVAATNVEQSVTELDYSIYSGNFNVPFTNYVDIPASRHNMVAYSYFNFLQALRQVPGKIVSLTIWGTSDDKSWLQSSTKVDAPLLFDESLKAKNAYWAFVDPLQLPGANLVTALTAPTTPVPAGQNFALGVTVTNKADTDLPFDPTDDDLPAANVVMTMSIPSHTSFQGLSFPTGWSCTSPGVNGTGQVTCTIPSLAVGAVGQFSVTVAQNDCSQPDGAFITASATATSSTANPNPTPQNMASTSVAVSNTPPVITARGSLLTTVECHTSYTELGADAVDACEGAVAVSISGAVDVNTVGTYGVEYDAVDLAGGRATPVVRTVQVSDTTPPQLGVLAPAPLTPPDHRYVTFPIASLVSAATDTCDSGVGLGSVVITQATSDEPDNGNGDGNTINDIVIAPDCKSVQVRAERAGPLNGRVYHITLRVKDASGNVTTNVATVTVPKDTSGAPAIDDGPAQTVTSACN